MPRTLSTGNQAGSILPNTVPHYLVELGFSTPLRFSSRGVTTYAMETFSAVTRMDVDIKLDGLSGSLVFTNDKFVYSDEFRDQGTAGITCKVWMTYDPAPVDADFDQIFDGELGRTKVGSVINALLVDTQKEFAPRWRANSTVFRFMLRDGTVFETENGYQKWSRS